MNWIDVILALLLAVFVALGVQRRLAGLTLGVGGVLLLRPLLLLGELSSILAIAAALLAGLLLAVIARRISQLKRLPPAPFAVLGGLGGALLGLTLILAAATSLPIERTIENQIVYPPQALPGPLAQAVRDSRVVREGRDILLYPLLDREGAIADAQRPVLRVLHAYLVVGEPWEGR